MTVLERLLAASGRCDLHRFAHKLGLATHRSGLGEV